MIRALAAPYPAGLGHQVDILVGSGPDDFGADVILGHLGLRIFHDSAPLDVIYDIAIMAIPFDGRWVNGQHFLANRIMDCRKRPDNVDRLGFDMWKKHEFEYQMENARELGWEGPPPPGSFSPLPKDVDNDLIYVGYGYKRDPGGFGLSKHFGNKRFADLMREIRKIRPATTFVSTGNIKDTMESGYGIIRELQDTSFYRCGFGDRGGLKESLDIIGGCKAYIGNDTGMMHVAASMGKPTCGLFAYPDLLVKNPPLCQRSLPIVFDADGPNVTELARNFVNLVWGQG